MSHGPLTFDDLHEILIDRIGVSPDDVPEDPDTPFTALGLDSLAIVELQLAVQQRYGFLIPDEEAQAITTPRVAVDYVNALLGVPEVTH